MQISQVPGKFTIPFANAAAAQYINAIPVLSQIGITAGAASLNDGFPPVTFLPVGAGGTPPWGRDFNGLFNQITAWSRWTAAGGLTFFDATFAAAVGGYMQGSLIASVMPGNAWVSTADNNVTNPDTTPGAPGWAGVAFITPIQNGAYVSADDTGSADNYVIAPAPAPVAYAKYQRFQVKIANANATTTPTLNVMGANGQLLGAKVIVTPTGAAVRAGQLAVGMIGTFIYDGAKFQLEQVASGGGLLNIQGFTASATYVPFTGASKALVLITGGGGAGGSASSCGGGGGAGATVMTLVGISFSSLPVTIGAGGAGVFNGAGGNGSPSSFGAFATANGGFGAPATNSGGLGSATGTGGIVIPGGDGVTVENQAPGFGSGTGGSSFWGGGGLGAPNIVGNPGRAYGAGGGGADSGGAGANGASGFCVVLEF
jgi:hypothetical protein